MLLEEEDCKLLSKIQEVLNSAEIKMNYELAGMGAVAMNAAAQRLPGGDSSGYGSKILRVTAYMLDKAAVWPGQFKSLTHPHNFTYRKNSDPLNGALIRDPGIAHAGTS